MTRNFKIYDFPRNLEVDLIEKLAESGMRVSKSPGNVDKVMQSILTGAGKPDYIKVLNLRYKEAMEVADIAKAMEISEDEVDRIINDSLSLVQNDVFRDAFGFEFREKEVEPKDNRKRPEYFPWNMVYDMVGPDTYWSEFRHTNDEFRSTVDFVIANHLDRAERLAIMYRYNTRKKMTDEAIADKIGISESEVPNLFESAFDRLRRPPCYEMIQLGITRYYQVQIALAIEEDRKKR